MDNNSRKVMPKNRYKNAIHTYIYNPTLLGEITNKIRLNRSKESCLAACLG